MDPGGAGPLLLRDGDVRALVERRQVRPVLETFGDFFLKCSQISKIRSQFDRKSKQG